MHGWKIVPGALLVGALLLGNGAEAAAKLTPKQIDEAVLFCHEAAKIAVRALLNQNHKLALAEAEKLMLEALNRSAAHRAKPAAERKRWDALVHEIYAKTYAQPDGKATERITMQACIQHGPHKVTRAQIDQGTQCKRYALSYQTVARYREYGFKEENAKHDIAVEERKGKLSVPEGRKDLDPPLTMWQRVQAEPKKTPQQFHDQAMAACLRR